MHTTQSSCLILRYNFASIDDEYTETGIGDNDMFIFMAW